MDEIEEPRKGYISTAENRQDNHAEPERQQAALRESAVRYHTIIETLSKIGEGLFIVDGNFRVQFMNEVMIHWFGDQTGRTCYSALAGLESKCPYCQIDKVFGNGETVRYQPTMPGGRSFDIVASPIANHDGTVSKLEVIRDITQYKRSEASLRQSIAVFETTRDGVLSTDLNGNILAVNRAFTEVTGYEEGEVLGQNPSILSSGRHDRAFYQSMWASLKEAGNWQGEIWNRRKNGETFPEWLTLSAVSNERGEPIHYVGVFTDISQLKQSEEQLARLTHYDPLTSLPNRLLMQSRLDHALERAKRHVTRVGVLLIDLDHFKTLNDSLGHPVGDELLVAVAQRLCRRLREEDTLGRLGGDEFLLLLETISDPQEAVVVARDLLGFLAKPFQLPGGHEIYVSASIGISVFPDDGASATELLRDADTAMYRAKNNGRNQFCFYTGDMNADALAKLGLEAALRRAIERSELVLHYQPKVDLRSGEITGAEALVRWQREGVGMVSPHQFIPLAEEIGLIASIGSWVIDAACRQMRTWLEDGLCDIRVAVNVSARQFHSGNLEAIVMEALNRHGIAPERLELELTESMLMDHPDLAVEQLEKLKRIGVKLSLDDFGTGYSSLAYLSRFPIDALKIDQSFVRDIVTEPDAAKIATSIIDLARHMHLRVVAEGVETEAQMGYLKKNHCDEMQGYYFSKPIPADEFSSLMRQEKSIAAADEGGDSRTLLVVDDDPGILSLIQLLLRGRGYRVLVARSAYEGMELLARNPVQVILSDQRMPEVSGVEFLERAKELYPDTVRIMLSGHADFDSAIRAVNKCAIYKFLTKPCFDDRLREHIRDAFQHYEAVGRLGVR